MVRLGNALMSTTSPSEAWVGNFRVRLSPTAGWRIAVNDTKTSSPEVFSPSSTTALKGPTANSTFQGLINPLGGNIFEITGITDTAGTYGGGTLNTVAISSLTATPFKTTGGATYTIPAGYGGVFVGLSPTIGEGYLTNAETTTTTTTTVAYAFDASQPLIVPISVTGSTLSVF
jgi:hypothetical protein